MTCNKRTHTLNLVYFPVYYNTSGRITKIYTKTDCLKINQNERTFQKTGKHTLFFIRLF